MSNSIYEEAIADAKSLKEAAEELAKQKLVEAMAPKIKSLVEKNLLDEDNEEDTDSSSDGNDSNKDSQDKNSDALEDDKDLSKEDVDNENYKINKESVDVFKTLMSDNLKKSMLENKLNDIKTHLKSVKKAILISEGSDIGQKRLKKLDNILNKLIKEIKSLKDSSIINSDTNLLETYLNISKELKTMSRRRRNNKRYLNESLDDLLEMNIFEDEGDEKQDADEDAVDVDDSVNLDDDQDQNPDDELTVSTEDLEGIQSGLENVADLVGNLLGGEGDQEFDVDLDDEAPLDDDEEDLLAGDDEDDSEEREDESYHMELDELEEKLYCADENEGQHLEVDEGADVIEIDENMLRREIGKMKRLREGDATAVASHFGGGSLDKEMFVDVDEGLLNALDDQLGDAPTPSLKKEVALRKNAQRKNRLMQKQLKEHKSALRSMKKQLNEMNLFNAKLLYANKLMQNRDLSIKQQKHIVESLDNANTLNEAKLLFESLSKSLTKSRKGSNLNEGASRRILGSSSRSVSSSQSVNKSADLDRWATLAGIKK